MNYIDGIASAIWNLTSDEPADAADTRLYRIYAVLALVVGRDCTNEHVHDAWAAWTASEGRADHRSLVPFSELPLDTQELDTLYRDAIRAVAGAPSFGRLR